MSKDKSLTRRLAVLLWRRLPPLPPPLPPPMHRSNQGISLESGSVDQFYESVVCMREIEAVGGCGVSRVKCTMQIAVMDNWMSMSEPHTSVFN